MCDASCDWGCSRSDSSNIGTASWYCPRPVVNGPNRRQQRGLGFRLVLQTRLQTLGAGIQQFTRRDLVAAVFLGIRQLEQVDEKARHLLCARAFMLGPFALLRDPIAFCGDTQRLPVRGRRKRQHQRGGAHPWPELRDTANDEVHSVMHSARKAGDHFNEAGAHGVNNLRESAVDYIDQGRAKAQNMEEVVEQRIANRPLQSILIVLGLDF